MVGHESRTNLKVDINALHHTILGSNGEVGCQRVGTRRTAISEATGIAQTHSRKHVKPALTAEEQTREAHHEVGMSVDVTQIMTIGAVRADRHIIYYRVMRTIYGTVGLKVAQIESF